MSKVKIYLKDYSGRDFGGDFRAAGVSSQIDGVAIDLEYAGNKSSKRLDVAAIILDREIIEKLCLLNHPRPWPQRAA